jgi:MFS family permease
MLLLFRLQELGVPTVSTPLIWALLHVIRSLASYPSGVVADRLGVGPALLAGAALNGVALIGLGLVESPSWGLALFLATGAVVGLTEPAERAAVARLAPSRRGAAFGRYQAFAGVGTLIAAVSFGWVYRDLGPALSLGLAAALGAVAVGGWLATERQVTA